MMCGRYYVDPDQDEEIERIIEHIKNKHKNTDTLAQMKTGEIFPTNIAPVITNKSYTLMQWGFSRFDGKGKVINARLETAQEKPMFRTPFIKYRCLMPASCYFEWEKRGTVKQKYAIGLNGPIYLAGLYRFERDSDIPLFVILTKPAEQEIAFIHDRMPVLVTPEKQQDWLSGSLDTIALLSAPAIQPVFREAAG